MLLNSHSSKRKLEDIEKHTKVNVKTKCNINMSDVTKAVLGGKIISQNAYIRKEEIRKQRSFKFPRETEKKCNPKIFSKSNKD